MTVKDIYKTGIRLLGGPEGDKRPSDPDVDIRALMAHPLGLNRNDLFLHKDRTLSPWTAAKILRNFRRREKLEPVAYILGYKDFFQDRIFVNRKCLIPRADTEHLLYAIQEAGRVFDRCLDIGTGSGALAVSLARLFPQANITAVDVSLSCARRNVRKLGARSVRLRKLDFLKSFDRLDGMFDLVVSNPPYLSNDDFRMLGPEAARYEPRGAFDGGPDGLAFYRIIAEFCRNRLAPGGLVVVETDHKWEKVREIFFQSGFRNVQVRKDYNGLDRVITAAR